MGTGVVVFFLILWLFCLVCFIAYFPYNKPEKKIIPTEVCLCLLSCFSLTILTYLLLYGYPNSSFDGFLGSTNITNLSEEQSTNIYPDCEEYYNQLQIARGYYRTTEYASLYTACVLHEEEEK